MYYPRDVGGGGDIIEEGGLEEEEGGGGGGVMGGDPTVEEVDALQSMSSEGEV